MNFLALFVGLGLERLLTNLFHLREFHWIDPVFDWVLRGRRIVQSNLAVAAAVLTTLIVVVPVGLVEWALQGELAQLPQFVFAVIVLLFCLGPRDLGEEVNAYCKALDEDDEQEQRQIAQELLERLPEEGQPAPDVEKAVYAQANNRIFGVVFWFVLLGPTGAWLFRVLDLMQRRAVLHANQNETVNEQDEITQVVHAILFLHRMFAWLPARLLAVGFMLAGSYEGALSAWKNLRTTDSLLFPGPNDQLLGAIGAGAAQTGTAASVADKAMAARDLVGRTLWMIWCPVLAVLTLYDLML